MPLIVPTAVAGKWGYLVRCDCAPYQQFCTRQMGPVRFLLVPGCPSSCRRCCDCLGCHSVGCCCLLGRHCRRHCGLLSGGRFALCFDAAIADFVTAPHAQSNHYTSWWYVVNNGGLFCLPGSSVPSSGAHLPGCEAMPLGQPLALDLLDRPLCYRSRPLALQSAGRFC